MVRNLWFMSIKFCKPIRHSDQVELKNSQLKGSKRNFNEKSVKGEKRFD